MTPKLKELLDLIRAAEQQFSTRPPNKRHLKFALYGGGKAYVDGDEERVRLACALFNARKELAELIEQSAGS